MESTRQPVMCTLGTKGAAEQVLEWSDLRGRAIDVEAIDGGARLRLPAEIEAQVADLVRRESACCTFLTITVDPAGDALVVEVTSDDDQARPVIAMIAGVELP